MEGSGGGAGEVKAEESGNDMRNKKKNCSQKDNRE